MKEYLCANNDIGVEIHKIESFTELLASCRPFVYTYME